VTSPDNIQDTVRAWFTGRLPSTWFAGPAEVLVDREEVRVVGVLPAAVPVMTRLRQPARRVLDTLVDARVARSRSDALAWCVHLVGQHAQEWLDELRTAMEQVERVRSQGPGSCSGARPQTQVRPGDRAAAQDG